VSFRLTSSGRVIVAVHVEYFRDLAGAVYTVALPDPSRPGETKGESFVVEDWAAVSVASAWCYAVMQSALAASEAGYSLDQFTIRGDRVDLPRLLMQPWDGKLGEALARFRTKFPFSDLHVQHRAGKALPPAEQAALVQVYRQLLEEHRASA